MNWVVTEDTPTATVVYMAAERIGKAQNHEQLQKICDYLVNKHWFQTASDLRSAHQETVEWQALEVPARLKLAIQSVLDQTNAPHHEPVPVFGYEKYYATVAPSTTTADDTATQQWGQTTTAYSSAEGVETATSYYTGTYDYSNSTAAQYGYDYSSVQNPASYSATSETSQDAYYNSSSGQDDATNYHESGAALITVAAVSSQEGHERTQHTESDVVEAHAVEVDECVEGELVPDQVSYDNTVERGQPDQSVEEIDGGTWSCGQCTYLNPMTESFCEMCIGHISLSPDVKTAPGTSASATMLVPAKPVVEVSFNTTQTETTPAAYSPHVLPPVASLYLPSAPEFEFREDDTAPLPYSATTTSNSVDFLTLAFSVPKSQAQRVPQTGKTSQMRREEAATITEYTI